MRPDLPTGTVTFLFTDIEGSTRLLHSLGPDAYADALAEHRRVLREAFAAHCGAEVDTQGDAFFVAFPTADGGAAAAVEASDALADGPIAVRMGLHTGAPTVTAEGYIGVDVHRGARIAALAHGGQIVLSPTTATLLDEVATRDLGLHRLKDFQEAVRLVQLGVGEFPPLRTPGSVELPTPATRFLGREHELFQAVSLYYERDPRVLTILGPGGTGKTRFALEVTRLLADEADGGSVFIALAPLRDAALVLPTIGDRLGASSGEAEAIAARVGDKRTHLLCDNLEHLLPDAARPLAELTAAAPALRLLTTSREPLRIQGEVELDLPPLAEDESVTLFVERARAVRPDLEADAAVSELCARLDHLPLALELAAARTKLLAPEALLARLGESLDLLKGTRDADERHTTLRATIAWSYDLLDEDERRLFRRLAVFRGGCTLESAEPVCDANLDVLASLLDKSLVRRRTGRFGEERFWMLETIREFAAKQLETSGEAEEIRRRHSELMLEIALSAHLTEDDDERFRLPRVLAEEQDMRAAVDWASTTDVELALGLIVALENFWNVHAAREVVRRLGDLLPRAGSAPPRLRAAALRVRGGALHTDGDFVGCDAWYDKSLVLYRELGDERGIASLLQRLANSAWRRREFERSRALVEESQEFAAGRFPYIEIANITVLGRIAVDSGEVEAGVDLLRQAADMAGDVDWHWWRAGALGTLAMIAARRGELSEAEQNSQQALRLIREDDDRVGTYVALTVLARVTLARADRRGAGLLWGALEGESAQSPHGIWLRVRADYAGPLLDETDPEFLTAVEDGKALDIWDAVALALGEQETPQTVP
jgi:predicted ATPase/class 3 adenylate cyclase